MCEKIKKMLTCERMLSVARCKIHLAEFWMMPATMLVMRVWLASIFWKSGVSKIYTDFAYGFLPYFSLTDSTYMLYEYEYDVPYLSPEFAAWSSTLVELMAPIMLVLGFGTRIAATALLVMSLVIHYTYFADDTHYMWMMFSAVLMAYGAGRFSADRLIRKRVLEK